MTMDPAIALDEIRNSVGSSVEIVVIDERDNLITNLGLPFWLTIDFDLRDIFRYNPDT